jgi:hypothetical protein
LELKTTKSDPTPHNGELFIHIVESPRSDTTGVFFSEKAGPRIWLELAGGIDSVRYQPSKEHLDNQIPNTIKQLRDLIQILQKETGADDRFIQSMLNQLSDSYGSSNTNEGRFGFR